MTQLKAKLATSVGPVLIAGRVADAVWLAIYARHPDAERTTNGGYVRVRVPTQCHVSRAAIEAELGCAFVLPRDLEAIMPAFKGQLRIDAEGASWES